MLSALLLMSACSGELSKSSGQQAEDIASIQSLVISQNDASDMEIISIGSLRQGSQKVIRILVKNETADVIALNNLKLSIEAWDDSTADNSSVVVINDRCSSRNLRVNVACYLDVLVSYNSALNSQPLSVLVTGSSEETSPKIQLVSSTLEDNLEESESKLSVLYSPISSVKLGNSYVRRIIVKNLSELNAYTMGSEFADTLVAPEIVILTNSCDGKQLPKLKSCIVDVQYTPTQEDQVVSLSLEIPGANLNQAIVFGTSPLGSASGRYFNISFSNYDKSSGGSFVISELQIIINGQAYLLSEEAISSSGYDLILSDGSYLSDTGSYQYYSGTASITLDLGSVKTINGFAFGVGGFPVNMEWSPGTITISSSSVSIADLSVIKTQNYIRSEFQKDTRKDILVE